MPSFIMFLRSFHEVVIDSSWVCFHARTTHLQQLSPHNAFYFYFSTHTGKIEKYERLGMPTPKGMVIDTEGKERTDTAQVRKWRLNYF